MEEEEIDQAGRWQPFKDAGIELRAAGTVEAAYTDNIFHFSNTEQEDFERNGATRETTFRHVDQLDDLVTVTRLQGALRKEFIPHRYSELAVGATLHVHGYNSVKNYEEYTVQWKQRLGQHTTSRLQYEYIPEYVIRDFFDEDQPAGDRHQLATYAQHAVTGALWHRFTPAISGRGFYRITREDYNHFFNERDNWTHLLQPAVTVKLAEGCVWQVYADLRYSDARAHDDDAEVDPDISYIQRGAGMRLALRPVRWLTIRPWYYWARRSFTTDQSTAEDRLHRDRVDIRQSWGVRASVPISERSRFYLEWARLDSDANIGFEAGSRGDTDTLGFEQNVVTVGFHCWL